jgi:CBS domain-containing protein
MAVRDVMRECDLCATEATPLVELAALMVLKRANYVPIVREGLLVGIVGMENIVDEIVWPRFRRDEDD